MALKSKIRKMDQSLIPRIIHYCWFGKKDLPGYATDCIQSWIKHNPEWKIIRWDEENYNYLKLKFTQEAYEAKKFAFVSDFARLDIINNIGGIYLDTDVKLIKSLNELTYMKTFFCRDNDGVNTGLGFGSTKNSYVLNEMMKFYHQKSFKINNGYDLTPCTQINTQVLKRLGLDLSRNETQHLAETTVLGSEYFSPIIGQTGEIKVTKKTIGIHLSARSWESGLTKITADLRMKLPSMLIRLLKKMYNLTKF